MRTGIIYKITNLVTGKVYVGQTTMLPMYRFSGHKSCNRISHPLYQDIKIFGIDKFEFSIIEENVPVDKLLQREDYWITALGCRQPFGYNKILSDSSIKEIDKRTGLLVKNRLGGRKQSWLCKQVGLTPVELSNAINGYRKFKFEEFERIKIALDITEEDIATIAIEDYVAPQKHSEQQ